MEAKRKNEEQLVTKYYKAKQLTLLFIPSIWTQTISMHGDSAEK